MEFTINGYNPFLHDGRFYYDAIAADKPIEFIERYLTHAKGRLARKPLILSEWQKDFVRCIFGFLHHNTGLRRYRSATLGVPRGNSKTTLAAALSLYFSFCLGEGGAENYFASTSRDTATLTYEVAAAMVRNSRYLKARLRTYDSRKRITHKRSNSYLAAVASDASNSQGWNTFFACCDELHEFQGQRGRDFYSAIETSLGKREGRSFILHTSTAGYDRTSLFWDLWSHSLLVKQNPAHDYTHLPCLWYAEPAEDWQDIRTYERCNPNWGKGVEPAFIQQQIDKAKSLPSFENQVKRMYLNQWTEQQDRLFSMADYYGCSTADLDLTNEYCVAGLDTSSSKDLTALVLYFPNVKALRCWCWIPGDGRRKSLQDGVDYETWARLYPDSIVLTKPNRIDRAAILAKGLDIKKRYKLLAVAFDPFESRHGLPADLHNKGIRMIEYGQSYSHMNEPTKMLEELISTRQLNRGDNPALDYCMANMCVETHSQGWIRPTKPEDNKRIDAAVAAVMAIGISRQVQPVTIIC